MVLASSFTVPRIMTVLPSVRLIFGGKLMVPVGGVTSARVMAVKARVWLPRENCAATGVLPLPLVTRRAVRVWLPGLRVTTGSWLKGPPSTE